LTSDACVGTTYGITRGGRSSALIPVTPAPERQREQHHRQAHDVDAQVADDPGVHAHDDVVVDDDLDEDPDEEVEVDHEQHVVEHAAKGSGLGSK
jgi:hypothetical protein